MLIHFMQHDISFCKFFIFRAIRSITTGLWWHDGFPINVIFDDIADEEWFDAETSIQSQNMQTP
jgi:hypothetical protein